MKVTASWILVLCLCCSVNAYAGVLYLKNGDRITGEVVAEDSETLSLKTEIMGTVLINKDFLDLIETDAQKESPQAEPKLWERKFSLGYNKSSGNSQNSQLAVSLYANRKTEFDEFTSKGSIFYSSSNKKMDSQKWDGLVRYAFSFWDKKWYNFYKFEIDHDRFANIDYRIIPGLGIGYWFSDTPDWKAMTECGIGLEHTKFRDVTGDENEVILLPRAFFQKKLAGNLEIKQDFSLYPSLEDTSQYRLHSETAFVNPINENLSLCLSLIDDYNSNPPADTKKNDTCFISSLIYSF